MKAKYQWLILFLLSVLVGCSSATTTPLSPSADIAEDTALPPTATTPIPTPEPSYMPVFEPTECFDADLRARLPAAGYDLECGYLVVPENREKPGGLQVKLPVVWFHSPNPNPRPDPVIYLMGGGGTDAMSAVTVYLGYVGDEFLKERDFIMYTQRGARYGDPEIICSGAARLDLELAQPDADGNPVPEEEKWARRSEFYFKCREKVIDELGVDLAMYNTTTNAADAQDLRIALGYEEANYYGTSYGTRLALFMMRDYPEGARTVIIDSVYPPQIDYYSHYAENAYLTINHLFESCADDDTCSQTYPDLETVFYEVVERLNAEPRLMAWNGETVIYDGGEFVDAVYFLLYIGEVDNTPKAIYEAYEGRFRRIENLMPWVLGLPNSIVSWGVFYSLQCREEVPFDSLENVAAVNADLPDAFTDYYAPFQTEPFTICEGWGIEPSDPTDDEAVISEIPTLVFGGEFDPITPTFWSEMAAETLPNSFFYLFPGFGHGVMRYDDCAMSMGLQFMDDPTSEPDSSCMDDLPGAVFK